MINGLSQFQIKMLAEPIVSKIDEIIEFFESEENQRKFDEWCLKKYGIKENAPDGGNRTGAK